MFHVSLLFLMYPAKVQLRLRMFILLFNSYCYHLHLHSFPTRRSSDLSPPRCRRSSTRAVSISRPQRIREPSTPTIWPRSEEHTSELQSQSNLVCRLLLEKKNKNFFKTNKIINNYVKYYIYIHIICIAN